MNPQRTPIQTGVMGKAVHRHSHTETKTTVLPTVSDLTLQDQYFVFMSPFYF